ncbi:hypothetical protein BDY17DRAFT_292031 [Neohortaea acidophila]|uniref:SWR1-complex protein 3 domain-containing protein n=1 Tax=Neohortaea acidophila TaxID=245834 RepID=A0A6A6Q464_9PEZI|nr:uncharacterized protein BDY17DRAFT_292031 [Neohortaea acidophila]KAF2486746.1 hypothetical protein BDY17DRAFT_292031 [Neohortaea acidophila]
MAQSEIAAAGHKRTASRLSKGAQPAGKKRKISAAHASSPSPAVQTPAETSPEPEEPIIQLPARVRGSRPLPSLKEQQAVSLSNNDYQTIAASAVLQTSLDRSRLKWIHDGVLERYWVKPESGKNAKPTPPNNPELKWQKHKGPCRIRVEPHIFEAEIYVEEKAKPPPPPPVKHYVPPNYQQSAYGQPYRPNQQPYGQQYYQNRGPTPAQRQPHGHSMSPGPNASHPGTPALQPHRPTPPSASPPQEKKASPDPVISMLANRASSDPELKALMKEVATGNASQEQLKVFQSHIDELTKIINDKKKKEEGAAAARPPPQQTEAIQYDGAGEAIQYDGAGKQPHQQRPYQAPAPAYQPPAWTPAPAAAAPPPPPAPRSLPVVLAFTNPGATEDRFLFPQNSIIEALSPQHLLASFITTRKGRESPEASNLEPDTEYWQPVTLMVEVAYNREHILDCVRKWVKPAEEVRKHMEEVMARCTKAEESYLAMRLPFKGSALAEAEDSGADEGTNTPNPASELQPKPRKYTKKSAAKSVNTETEKTEAEKNEAEKNEAVKGSAVDSSAAKDQTAAEAPATEKPSNDGPVSDVAAAPSAAEPAVEDNLEGSRPKRSTRKSVRISEA